MNVNEEMEIVTAWLLRELKKLLYIKPKENKVLFCFQHPTKGNPTPLVLDQDKVLDFLINQGIIVDNGVYYRNPLIGGVANFTGEKIFPDGYNLTLDIKKFNSLYKKYESKINQLSSYKRVEHSFFQDRNNKLVFIPESGRTIFRGNEKEFKKGTKTRVLLTFLSENKRTSFTVDDVMRFCNNKLTTEKKRFRDKKDLEDTVTRIKNDLGVKKEEVFPIEYSSGVVIWAEK